MSNTARIKPVTASISGPRSRTGGKPQTKSKVAIRARIVSYPQRRAIAQARKIETALVRAFLFASLTCFVFGVSSVVGQVMVEQSRKEQSNALARTQSAAHQALGLRAHINELTRPDSVESWATEHQFITDLAPKAAAAANSPHASLVALNH